MDINDIVLPSMDKIAFLVIISSLCATAVTEFFKQTRLLGLVDLVNRLTKKERGYTPAWFRALKRVLPIISGGVLGYWASAEGLIGSKFIALSCGMSVGLFSTLVYKRAKDWIGSFQLPSASAAGEQPPQ